jgi:hypothetical protein
LPSERLFLSINYTVTFSKASTFKKQYQWHHPDPDNSDGKERPYWVLIDPNELIEGKVDVEEVRQGTSMRRWVA